MYKFLVVLFLFFTTGVNASMAMGTADAQKKGLLRVDSAKLNLRHFDHKKIARYRKMPDFIYDDVKSVDMDLWNRFWRWLSKLFSGKQVSKGSYSGAIFKYVAIGTLAAWVIFLLIKIAGLDLRIIFGKSKAVEVPYHESLENIHQIDFNEELTHAINGKNYRLAVRLLYLNALKKLSDRQLIDWQPEKTNQNYIDELKDLDKKRLFKSLTLQFEYVWYGEFYIDQENFADIKSLFDQFNPAKS